MDGLFIFNNSESLENILMKSSELSLLASGNGTDIMIHKIDKNQVFCIEPGEEDLTEFCYILEGVVEYEKDKRLLTKGDYFYARNLEEPIILNVKERVKFLYVTTKPVFKYLSNTMKEFQTTLEKIEQKDHYTYAHCSRVERYSILLAKKLKLSQEKIRLTSLAALFHDIGKANILEEILNKPGKLTNEEFDIIRQHSSMSAEIIKGTFLEEVSEIVIQHHERIDGKGYPKGLKGNEIRLEAKIICITDAYDAMTVDRPYRRGMNPNDAIKELKECTGSQFDEDIVLAFEEVLKEENIIA